MTHNDPIHSLLSRGVAEVIDRKHLEARLKKREKLRIKFGIDPTGDLLHIGHSLPLLKLREFQQLGHTVILLIGDFTATIGDPTGRNTERPALDRKQVELNMRSYESQASKILDMKKVEVRHNSEWFDSFSFMDLIKLSSNATVAQLKQRADFKDRLEKNIDISMNEFLYPVLQGYDSVMLKADVEIGGTDQKFNLLMGRQIQKRHNQPEQDIITIPILEGLDGVDKMSKSLGNFISISENPSDMYGKVMSIPDTILWKYFEFVTKVPEKEINEMSRQIKTGTLHPRDAKMYLAREIVAMYHSKKDSESAELQFIQVFQQQKRPDEIPVVNIAKKTVSLIDALVETKLATSKTDARTLIKQKSVKIDDEVVADIEHTLTVTAKGIVIQKGKRYFVRVMGK